jgi:hypothetical protein
LPLSLSLSLHLCQSVSLSVCLLVVRQCVKQVCVCSFKEPAPLNPKH